MAEVLWQLLGPRGVVIKSWLPPWDWPPPAYRQGALSCLLVPPGVCGGEGGRGKHSFPS